MVNIPSKPDICPPKFYSTFSKNLNTFAFQSLLVFMEAQKLAEEPTSLYKNLSPDEKVEILFRKYYPALCKSLYRILKDVSLAEDIVQEVFLKVWDKRHNLQLDEAFQGYLYRSCYNTALNFVKQQKPGRDVEITSVAAFSSQDADSTLQFLETEDQILQAIDSLPPKTRQVFSLSRFEELSYKEIAARLDISIKSVEKHMGIALQRLRESLKDYLFGYLIFMLSQLF